MARTGANFRAALHSAEAADNAPRKASLECDSPIERKKRGSTNRRTPFLMRWRIAFDIAAPKILLPDKFWPEDGAASAVVGVLCDFGRFRLSNWQPSVDNISEAAPNPQVCPI